MLVNKVKLSPDRIILHITIINIIQIFECFRVFIVATGCTSKRRPPPPSPPPHTHTPRRRLIVTGDSARIKDETTESFAWFGI